MIDGNIWRWERKWHNAHLKVCLFNPLQNWTINSICMFFFSKQICITLVSSLGVFYPTPFMWPEVPKMIWQVMEIPFWCSFNEPNTHLRFGGKVTLSTISTPWFLRLVLLKNVGFCSTDCQHLWFWSWPPVWLSLLIVINHIYFYKKICIILLGRNDD